MISISVIENCDRHLQIIAKHIHQHPQYRLVSTATNGFEFVQFCYRSKQLPEIALVDVEMEVMDGVTLVDYLKDFFPEIKCIAVTGHAHKEMLEDMMGCGAIGIVFKLFVLNEAIFEPENYGLSHKFESLDDSITAAVNNEFYLDKLINTKNNSDIAQLDRNALIAAQQQQKLANAAFGLTKRESEIVLLCTGTTARQDEIASMMNMSVQNLKLILSGIYKKMGTEDRFTLTFLCQRKSIVKNARNIVGVAKE